MFNETESFLPADAAVIGTAAAAVDTARTTLMSNAAEAAQIETAIAALEVRHAQLRAPATVATSPVPTRATSPAPTRATSPVTTRDTSPVPTRETPPAQTRDTPVVPAADSDLTEFRVWRDRDRRGAQIATLQGYGLTTAITAAQALTLAPDVDPRDPEGLATFERFRDDNPHLFAPAVSAAEAQLRAQLEPMARSGIFNMDKLIAGRESFRVTPPAPRVRQAPDVEAVRAAAGARVNGLFSGARIADRMLGASTTRKP